MRKIYVKTDKGVVVAYGNLYIGKKDSFGREVFENDRIEVSYRTPFGSLIITEAEVIHTPIDGGFIILPDSDLTSVLECDIVQIIKVLDEKEETDKDKNIGIQSDVLSQTNSSS